MAEDDFGLSVFIFERERERERERETTVKYLRQFHFLTSILEDPNGEYTNTEHIPWGNTLGYIVNWQFKWLCLYVSIGIIYMIRSWFPFIR